MPRCIAASKGYSYDKNGNQTGWEHDISGKGDKSSGTRRTASGPFMTMALLSIIPTMLPVPGSSRVEPDRVGSGQAAYVNNEHKGGSGNMGNYTVYVNPYIVLKSGGYTKHYYIEGQRIVSKLGGGMADAGKSPKAGSDKVNYPDKQEQSREGIVRNLKFLGHDGALLTAGNSGKTPPGQVIGEGEGGGNGNGGGKDSEKFQYFYHPDHLGSSSYITDASGEVYQHLEYFAFGETFVEEHSNTQRTPYLFNGKELDEETGLYYYGARYYEPQISVWLSVDELAEDPMQEDKSPYAYSWNNPVVYNDPDGNCPSCVGALVGGLVDAGLQLAEIGLDDSKSLSDFSFKSVAISAATGAVGVGIASKVSKVVKIGKLGATLLREGSESAVDGAGSAANQYAKNGEIDILEVGIDVLAGKTIGKVAGNKSKEIAKSSSEGKILSKQLNRAKRVAGDNPRPSRAAKVDNAQKKLDGFVERRGATAGVASSNTVSGAVKGVLDSQKSEE